MKKSIMKSFRFSPNEIEMLEILKNDFGYGFTDILKWAIVTYFTMIYYPNVYVKLINGKLYQIHEID